MTQSSKKKLGPLLSIAIPCYNRPEELSLALQTFADQIEKGFSKLVEIIVTDDLSTDDTPKIGRAFAKKYPFIKFKQNKENIGLEKNLIHCTKSCKGEFLWIFGDDDYLEFDSSVDEILEVLSKGQYDFLVLNRMRRSKNLSKTLSDNWMNIPIDENRNYSGLREFCLDKGLISIIGFISVNIFRRKPFSAINPDIYFGTMYPQLGMMLEAFHNKPVLLIGKPHIVHRTATMAEKREILGNKTSEKDFMADEKRRNAIYFSHPFFRLIQELIDKGAFTTDDITKIPENTVIQGLLIDFLIQTAKLAYNLDHAFAKEEWVTARRFFENLSLKAAQKAQLRIVWADFRKDKPDYKTKLTFSVITPSYNQAEFLQESLEISQSQSIKPIEHFVFDPGSTDNSRQIAKNIPNVTLVAEEDEGQSDAINKGFKRVKGDIIAWVNSDDCYIDDLVFERVAERFDEPDAPDIVYGKGIFEDEDGRFLRDAYVNPNPKTLPWRLQHEDGILQPALFMRRHVLEKVGLLTLHRHHCMDYEYWIRCMKAGVKFAFIDEYLARAKYHSSNKTFGERDKSYIDVCDMLIDQFGYANHIWLKRYAEYLASGYDGVLTNAANQDTNDEAKIEFHYDKLLRAYNTSADTYSLLTSKATEKGYGDTLRELKNRGITPLTPCKTIPLNQAWEAGYTAYTVAKRRWAFETSWKSKQISKSHAELRKSINQRKSDTCIIVGNGPSLNKIDMNLFKGHDVIVSNNVHLSPELMSHATFYTVVNYLVAEQSAQHINQMIGVKKIIPYWLAYCLNEGPNTFFVDAVGHAEFSTDMFENMSWRHTVTFFNMHLAYGLGYRKVVLTGFDHSYGQQRGVKEGETLLSNQPDTNHFNGKYFQGKKWQAADVDMMEEMYKLAKAAFDADGREIINATVGGHLELFPRQELSHALSAPVKLPHRESIMKSTYKSMEYNREDNYTLDETDLIYELMKNSHKVGTMIDVGAHYGSALAPFQRLNWDIYAYEPDSKNRAHLEKKFGKKRNVKINSCAVSDKPDTGHIFYSSAKSTGISGMLAFHDSHKPSDIVNVTTIEKIVHDENIKHIEFLKIDVEGYDFNVLKGIPWSKLRPDVIECEFEDAKTVHLGHSWSDICEYLEGKGYTVYVSEWHPIVQYGIPHQWRVLKRFPCNLLDDNAWGNLLAFKTDPGSAEIEKALKASLKVKFQEPPKIQSSEAIAPMLAKPMSESAQQSSADLNSVKRPLYANLADKLRQKSLALFRIGQFLIWSMRFLKRHALLAIVGIFIFGVLTLSPLLIPTLAQYALMSWGVAAILVIGGFSVVIAAFANMIANRIAIRENINRKKMEQDILKKINQIKKDFIDNVAQDFEGKIINIEKLNSDKLKISNKKLEIRVNTQLSNMREVMKETEEKLLSLNISQDNFTKNIKTFTKEFSLQKNEFHSQKTLSSQKHSEIEQEFKDIARKRAFIEQEITGLQTKIDELNKIVDIVKPHGELDYQNFNRAFTNQHAFIIEQDWLTPLNLKISRRAMAYFAQRIKQTEKNSLGRLATTIEDAMLRVLISKAVTGQTLDVLEIGTLFGIGAAIIYERTQAEFESVHLTVLDPFEGYYGNNDPDVITHERVTKSNFLQNFNRAGIPQSDYTIIQGFSTAEKSIQEASKKSYDVLIIDGDHSYAGVKGDFVTFAPFVKRGGFIIVDDYNTEHWPEIAKYVDNELIPRDDISLVGATWRTAVFKVIKPVQ